MRIGYATSVDGILWKKHPTNPVLDLGASGAWDEYLVSYPTVLFNGAEYQMWYSGYDGSVRIGYATSIPEPTLTIKTNKEIYNPWERVQALADVGNPGSSFTANLLERSISLTLSEVISTDMGLRT